MFYSIANIDLVGSAGPVYYAVYVNFTNSVNIEMAKIQSVVNHKVKWTRIYRVTMKSFVIIYQIVFVELQF